MQTRRVLKQILYISYDFFTMQWFDYNKKYSYIYISCLLYTSDAADE